MKEDKLMTNPNFIKLYEALPQQQQALIQKIKRTINESAVNKLPRLIKTGNLFNAEALK